MELNSKTKSPVNILETPNGWKKKNLKSLSKFFSGGTPLTTKPEFYNGGIPFIKSGEIYNDTTAQFITEEGLNNSSAKMIEKGDLLFALYGANSGEVAISKMRGAINQAILCIKHNEHCDTTFLYNYLLIQKERIIRTYLQGGQGNLSAEIVKSLTILLPPLPEQRAIAKVLSSMDQAINVNNQLIAQKELRKKWLMQNLLTGKKRLKGFSGEWKDIHIKDVSKEISIRNKDDKPLIVLSCTKYDGLVPSLEYFGRKIYSDNLKTYKIVSKNHFAYATNHIEEGSIGYNDVLDEALISPMYTIFKTDKSVNDIFFFKLLKSHRLIYEYNARMEGSIDRRGGLRWNAFSIIKIKLPSFDEQTAIAKILQAVDKELNLLKAKTDKLKEQKKGMMQQLLTGKKRLL